MLKFDKYNIKMVLNLASFIIKIARIVLFTGEKWKDPSHSGFIKDDLICLNSSLKTL